MSRPLYLDFAYPIPKSPFGVILLVLGVLSISITGVFHWQMNEDLDAQQRALRTLHPTIGKTSEVRIPATTIAHLTEVLDRLNFPWENLFAALESATGENLTLTAVLPDPVKGSLQLRGESRDMATVVAYVQALERSGVLSQVELAEHELNDKSTELRFRFLLHAKWRKEAGKI